MPDLDNATLHNWLHHWQDEFDAAYLYLVLAGQEPDQKKKEIYVKLAGVEERLAAIAEWYSGPGDLESSGKAESLKIKNSDDYFAFVRGGQQRRTRNHERLIGQAVEELKAAWLKQDKAKLEAMTLPELSYSHSDARLEDKAKFIEGVMGRKATVKSLEFPEMTVQVVGNTAIVRHLWVSQTELEGKVTDTKIGVMQVWQKQDGGWKLLARASYRLPQQA